MARGEVLVAIDVGTSGARAVAIGLEGDRYLEVRKAYPTTSPAPGWAEQDPRAWRTAALAALAGLVRQLGSRRRVLAIGLTGQCPSVCLVDADGRPLGPGLIYRDNRATAEAAAIRERFGDAAIHARTGHLPAAFHIGPKLMWLKAHEPALFARAASALQPRDLVAHALTGEMATDGTHAAATLCLRSPPAGVGRGSAGCAGTSPAALPPAARLSRATGRPRPGHRAARWPAGRTAGHPGRRRLAGLRAGSRRRRTRTGERDGGLLDLPERRRAGAAAGPGGHALSARCPGPFTTETGINTAGAAVTWVADLLYAARGRRARGADYARLDREAADVPGGADGVLALPTLADGERTDPDLRAVFTGLSLRHGRAVLARAMLEGVAFAIRDQLDLLADGGARVTELRVSGGDTRLATWNQIKADVLGVPVVAVPGDAAVAGRRHARRAGRRDLPRRGRRDRALRPPPRSDRANHPHTRSTTSDSRRGGSLPLRLSSAGGLTDAPSARDQPCFAVKRWPRPEDWAPVVRDRLGLRLVQHSLDLVDLTGSERRDAQALALRTASADHGLELHSTFTGLAAYSANLLLAPDASDREAAMAWYRSAIGFTAQVGGRATGGHVGCFSVADWRDPARRAELWTALANPCRRSRPRPEPPDWNICSSRTWRSRASLRPWR